MKYEDDIHNCTNERLAEMLDIDAIYHEMTYGEAKALVDEARMRLRERHKTPFNSEAFDL